MLKVLGIIVFVVAAAGVLLLIGAGLLIRYASMPDESAPRAPGRRSDHRRVS